MFEEQCPSYKVFQFYCDHCHWKRISEKGEVEGLYEVKRSSLQTNIPRLDPLTKKTVLAPEQNQKRKFRCPSCGFGIIPRLIPDPQRTQDKQVEINQRVAERKKLEEEVINREKKEKDENRINGRKAGS